MIDNTSKAFKDEEAAIEREKAIIEAAEIKAKKVRRAK